jgi:hypothetical protein
LFGPFWLAYKGLYISAWGVFIAVPIILAAYLPIYNKVPDDAYGTKQNLAIMMGFIFGVSLLSIILWLGGRGYRTYAEFLDNHTVERIEADKHLGKISLTIMAVIVGCVVILNVIAFLKEVIHVG